MKTHILAFLCQMHILSMTPETYIILMVMLKEENSENKASFVQKKWIDRAFDFLAEICHLCVLRLLPKFIILLSYTSICLQHSKNPLKGTDFPQCSIIRMISAAWDLQHLSPATYFPSKNECFIILVNIPSSTAENQTQSF